MREDVKYMKLICRVIVEKFKTKDIIAENDWDNVPKHLLPGVKSLIKSYCVHLAKEHQVENIKFTTKFAMISNNQRSEFSIKLLNAERIN